jgi:hypothetical protein
MWFSKKTTVDCGRYNKDGFAFTLVTNSNGQAVPFVNSARLFEYLVDTFPLAQGELKNRMSEICEKEGSNKWRTYKFYASRDVGPLLINQFDGSSHVKNWKVHDSNAFGKNDMVVIEYVADKQILFQTSDGVLVRV